MFGFDCSQCGAPEFLLWVSNPLAESSSHLIKHEFYWWNNEHKLKYSNLKDIQSYSLPPPPSPCSSPSPEHHFWWMRTALMNHSRLAAPHCVALLLGQGRPLAAGQTWVSPGPPLWLYEASSFSKHVMPAMMPSPCSSRGGKCNSWHKSCLLGRWGLTRSATHAAAKAGRLLSLLARPYAFCWKQQIMRQILVNGHALIDISCVVIGRRERIWLLTFKEKRGLDFFFGLF